MVLQLTVGKTPTEPQPAFQRRRSFVERKIQVSIKLAPDPKNNQPIAFTGSGGSDTVVLAGFRMVARIERSGAPAGSRAHVSIFGLPDAIMNQLQTLGANYTQIARNTMVVSAGDDVVGLTPVIGGTIFNAWADYNAAPNVPFHIECQAGVAESVLPSPASSFTGATDVATIMAGFARRMNVGFENNGVTAQLQSPYLAGNVWQQVQKVARDVHINAALVDGECKVLAIWPIGGSRNQRGAIPLISKETGMIGSPIFWQQNGAIVRHLFNPQVSFGSKIRVESTVATKATQTYVVYKLDLALDAQVPNGKWEASAYCYRDGLLVPIPPQSIP